MKNINEVAEILGVGKGTVEAWVKEGKLVAGTDTNGNLVFRESQIDDFIERTGIKLIKPTEITNEIIKFFQDHHSKTNDLMTADQIEKLFSENKE